VGLEPLNTNVIQQTPDLKAIARVGIGKNNVDSKSAQTHKIIVSNTPGGPTDAVVEITISATLSLSRNIKTANNASFKKSGQN
jgi:D-3-phosphoglycerate dehydrogenase / 2-oxoglutarate reductase